MSSRADAFSTVRIEGAILPADLLQRVAAGDAGLRGLRPEDYHLAGEKLNEAANRAWARLVPAWQAFRAESERLPPADDGLDFTLRRWLLPFWRALDYGQLDQAHPVEIDGKAYPISHVRYNCPVHLVSFRRDLDKRVETRQARLPSPHGMVQELLNRSAAHLWGFVGNGFKLRILRDNIRLTRQAYVEFDLQAMFDGGAYADFALLWRLCHESRVKLENVGDGVNEASVNPADCWLERWSKAAQQQGLRALDQLRGGVERAVEALGRGFLCPANADLASKLRAGTLTAADYYRQLLRLVYRLLFLFVAEDRELLFDPHAGAEARDRYAQFYSTARLRRLSGRVRGTPHADLYQGLDLVLTRLGTTGCPELGLPALGGLFDPAGTRDLAGCRVPNVELLEAVRALSVVSDGQSLRQVDYRNLGAEELGGVYESLLELHPRFDPTAGTFALATAAGNERKTTGSYYTPRELIACLLDSALDPVLDEAARKPDPEGAILALKVCDPACGSGHFLIAAAHRLARKLASVRTHEEEPAPDAVRHALRDVVGRCVFGVDNNPMAVELCKVALWMEGLEPGKPLSFLDHHVQCGNSLLGATPALLANGIPNEAFEPIEGDDKRVCSAIKKQNKEERRGQGNLFVDAAPWDQLGNLAVAMAAVDALPDETADQVRSKADRYERLVADASYRTSGRFLADLWCAAFVWQKSNAFDYPITEGVFRRVEKNPHDVQPWMYAEVRRLAGQYQFLHWHLAFPGVFRPPSKGERPDNELTGLCGGFDVVLGNPPWERIKLQEQEWFAAHGRADIAEARTAAIRGRMIQALATSDAFLHRAFLDDRRKAEGESHLVRHSSADDEKSGRRGLFPLCGRGDVNTYSLFAELNRNLIAPAGRVGCVVPTGIATDDTTKAFFQDLMAASIVSLFGFENEEFIFPGVHHSTKFCLLTFAGQARPQSDAVFVFFARRVEQLEDPDRRVLLAAADLAILSPNTGTCPVFRYARDAALSKAIYRRVPILVREGGQPANPWGVRFLAMLHMANDSGLFRTEADLSDGGWRLDSNVFLKDRASYLPLYEAKMFHQFDHRWGSYAGQSEAQSNQGKLPELSAEQHAEPTRLVMPRYWVPAGEVDERLRDRWDRGWLLAWRDICRNTDSRTTIASIVPKVGVGHTSPLMLSAQPTTLVAGLYANLTSFVLDYAARQKVGGTHMTFGLVNQLPVVPPARYAASCPWSPGEELGGWICSRVVELTYTATDLKPFAEDCGYNGEPFRWNEERRFQFRCELDAAYFHLYFGAGAWQPVTGEAAADFVRLMEVFPTPRDAVAYVMDTFPIVRRADEERHGRYRTKERILELYDELASGRVGSSLHSHAAVSQSARSEEDEPQYGPPLDLFGEPLDRPTDEDLVIRAFCEVRDDWSSEYIVCNPEYERRFHDRVEALAPRLDPANANMMLWNARRSGKLSHLPKSKFYSPPAELAAYEFVCEWAYRFLIAGLVNEGWDRRKTTLERILCNPPWRAEFDRLVTRIKPGFSPLDYRWVAMRVRKRSGDQRVATPSLFDAIVPAKEAARKLPDSPGVYLICSTADEQLYTGWAPNLREQATRLVATGNGEIIPDWLLDGKPPAETVAFQAVAVGTTESDLHSIWRANLYRGRPLLNLFEEEAA